MTYTLPIGYGLKPAYRRHLDAERKLRDVAAAYDLDPDALVEDARWLALSTRYDYPAACHEIADRERARAQMTYAGRAHAVRVARPLGDALTGLVSELRRLVG